MKARYNLKLIAFLVTIALVAFYPSVAQAQTAQQVAQKALPSIVLIVAKPAKGKSLSLGSGFFVESDVIATAYHVIKGASALYIKREKEIYKVSKVLAVDAVHDLALLRVLYISGPPLDLADDPDSDDPQWKIPEGFTLITSLSIGEEVYAIGNPEGLEGTFSQGIVSGIRFINKKSYIQITAPISHGSSGGPVLNKNGEVVGIAVGALRSGQNLNFAIPVSELRSLVSRLGSHPIKLRWDQLEEVVESPAERPSNNKFLEALATVQAEECFKQGKSYSESLQYSKAIEEYKRAIKLKPDYAEAYYSLGEAYLRSSWHGVDKQEANSALEAYKQAIRIQPHYSEAHLGLGITYRCLNRYDEAIEAIEQSIQIKQSNSNAFLELAIIYLLKTGTEIGDQNASYMRKARSLLNQAILLDPKNIQAYCHLGDAYHEEKMGYDEIATYNKALRIFLDNPDIDEFERLGLYMRLCGYYKSSSHFSEGIEMFNKIVKIRPKDDEAYLRLGELYLLNKDKTSALKVYEILKGLESYKANTLFDSIYK